MTRGGRTTAELSGPPRRIAGPCPPAGRWPSLATGHDAYDIVRDVAGKQRHRRRQQAPVLSSDGIFWRVVGHRRVLQGDERDPIDAPAIRGRKIVNGQKRG